MEPCLSNNDKLMFYKYLDKSIIYFEFGSGGSTYQAALKKNIKKIYSVESDLEWHNKLKEILKNENKIIFIYNEMDAIPNNWGSPGPSSTDIQRKNYSNHPLYLNKNEKNNIDLILIDGRFRVSCCLKCFDIINNNCFIAFDDFLNRSCYHIVLDYYDIIEKTIDNRMVILKKKKNINFVPKELIEKYELISS
jgi:hypothetical protein